MRKRRSKLSRSLAKECDAVATSIVDDAIAISAISPIDGSLRGAAALLLATDDLDRKTAAGRSWIRATRGAVDELEASFFDGMLGSAWVLATIGGHDSELALLDDAILDALASAWTGGFAPFQGGLAGFGLYGLARSRTARGKRIVIRCVELFEALATKSGSAIRWTPPDVHALLNMEGSAAAVGFLAAAARVGVAGARKLAAVGARTLAKDVVDDVTDGVVGTVTNFSVPGIVHGSGTWALGSAGVAAALLGVARATGVAPAIFCVSYKKMKLPTKLEVYI
jgi:hypothetical protein